MALITGTRSHIQATGGRPEGAEKTPILMDKDTLRLIQACQRGEAAAWDTLIRRYQPLLYRYAHSLCHNREEAADIVGQVFLRLCRNLPTLREGENFTSWLYCIVRHCFLDHCIRPKHRSHLSLDTGLTNEDQEEEGFDFPDPSPSPETVCLQKETVEEITEAIRYLPAYQRQMVDLFYSQSKSYQEISQATGLSLGTVKTRLHRARQTLHKRLEIGAGGSLQ